MPVTYRSATLPNGIRVVAEVDPAAHTAAAGFYVKTGARDEEPRIMGVSHFLEHMMFKGTATMTAEELNRRFDRMGARNNAFTSNELTCFYAHVLPEHAPACLGLLAEMMRPALRAKDFETEKGVILEEIAMYEDNPFWILYEAAVERHFGHHPLAHRVLGTKATITALPREAMQAYFDARYSADNTLVSLAGNIDFDAACDLVQARCGNWPRTRPARDNASPPLTGGTFTITHPKVTRGYVFAMCKAPGYADERRYAASVVAHILGGSDNSRMHWSLIEPGVAEEAQSSYEPHDGFGEFFVYASGEPTSLDDIWNICHRDMRDLRDSLTQEDLDLLLNKFVTGITLGGERPHDRMHRLGRMSMYLDRYIPLEEELDRLQALTVADLRAVCDDFPLEPVTLGKLLPENSPATAASAAPPTRP